MKKVESKVRNRALCGVTCFVETKNSDGSDASKATTILLQNLGATVESTGIRMGLSHFIWSNGNINHVKAAQFMDIIVVTPLWVKCCSDAGSFVSETDFLVVVDSINSHLPPPAAAVESVSARASELREPDSPFFNSWTRIQRLQPNISASTKEKIVLDNPFSSTLHNTNSKSSNNSIHSVIPVPSFSSIDKSNTNISAERVGPMKQSSEKISSTSFQSSNKLSKRRSERISEMKSPPRLVDQTSEFVNITTNPVPLKAHLVNDKETTATSYPTKINADTELIVVRETSAIAVTEVDNLPKKKRKSQPIVNNINITSNQTLIQDESSANKNSGRINKNTIPTSTAVVTSHPASPHCNLSTKYPTSPTNSSPLLPTKENYRHTRNTQKILACITSNNTSCTTASTSSSVASSTTINTNTYTKTRAKSISTSRINQPVPVLQVSSPVPVLPVEHTPISKDKQVSPQGRRNQNISKLSLPDNNITKTTTLSTSVSHTTLSNKNNLLLVQTASSSSTSSTTNNSFKIALSGYHTDDRLLFTSIINAISSSCGWGEHINEDDPTSECSIVIAPKGEDCRRTLRVLFCLANGITIVTEEWLFASLEANHWINPYASLIHNISNSNSTSTNCLHPRFSTRYLAIYNNMIQVDKNKILNMCITDINNNIFKWDDNNKLLSGLSVYIEDLESNKTKRTYKQELPSNSNSTSSSPPLTVVYHLIIVCGGEVCPDTTKADIYLKQEDEPIKINKNKATKSDKIIVTYKELFDALERGYWLPIHSIYSKTTRTTITNNNISTTTTSSITNNTQNEVRVTIEATTTRTSSTTSASSNSSIDNSVSPTPIKVTVPVPVPVSNVSRRNNNSRKPPVTKKYLPTEEENIRNTNIISNVTVDNTMSSPILVHSPTVLKPPITAVDKSITLTTTNTNSNVTRSKRGGSGGSTSNNNDITSHSKENINNENITAVSSPRPIRLDIAPHNNRSTSSSSNTSNSNNSNSNSSNTRKVKEVINKTVAVTSKNDYSTITNKRKHPSDPTSTTSSTSTNNTTQSNFKRLKTNNKLASPKLVSTNKNNYEFDYDNDEEEEWNDDSRYAGSSRSIRETESPSF